MRPLVGLTPCIRSPPFGPSAARMFAMASCLRSRLRLTPTYNAFFMSKPTPTLAIVGAGPAGLMAAETARAAGLEVDVYEAKGSVGRKFLLAGVGGMNLTHGEPRPAFDGRYGERAAE